MIFVVALFGWFYLYIIHKDLKSHMEHSRTINYKLNNKTYKYTPKKEHFLRMNRQKKKSRTGQSWQDEILEAEGEGCASCFI